MRYEVRDAITSCGYGFDREILECYVDGFATDADDDASAIAYVERVQRSHDAKAQAVVDAGIVRNAQEQYDNAPCYVTCLWRITDDGEAEKVEL